MATTVDTESTPTADREAHTAESFGDAVRRVVRLPDAVILLFPAAVFLGVGIFPPGVRQQLAFSYGDPDVLTAFTSHFAHADAAHLLRNLAGYLIIVPTVYLLSVLAGRRQLFYTVFVVILAAFPFVLSGLNLVVPREALSLGGSGLTLGFVGYLPVAVAAYVRRWFGVDDVVRREIAGGLFFLGLIVIIPLVVAAFRPVLAIVLTAISVLAVVGYGLTLRNSGIDRETLRKSPPGFAEFGVWSGFVLTAALITGFAADPLSDAGLVNTYTHFLGYALGFLSSYLVVLLFSGDSEL